MLLILCKQGFHKQLFNSSSSQQGRLATYLILGFVGRAVKLGSEKSSGGTGGGRLSGKRERGARRTREVKSPKMEISRMKVCLTQNVSKVLISGKEILPNTFGAILDHFLCQSFLDKNYNLLYYLCPIGFQKVIRLPWLLFTLGGSPYR